MAGFSEHGNESGFHLGQEYSDWLSDYIHLNKNSNPLGDNREQENFFFQDTKDISVFYH